MRKLAHETQLAQKHAVAEDLYWEFQPGERVIADGFPGVVKAVNDTYLPGNESYEVVLDNGVGGGEYTAAQLSRPDSVTASLIDTAVLSGELEPVEATSISLASHWYPELGEILTERPPIEQVQKTAGLRRTAAHADYQQGMEHGLIGTQGNLPFLQRRLDRGQELDEEDQDYARGHQEGSAEAARREQERSQTGGYKCPECAGSGMGVWRGDTRCSSCHGSGSISAEEANKTDVLHHLTDDPHFTPDPHHVPEDNAIAIDQRSRPGLFAARPDDIGTWAHGHGYDRPYVAEIHVPRFAHEPGRWGGERFIPAEHLDKATVTRVVPRQQHTAMGQAGPDYDNLSFKNMTGFEYGAHPDLHHHELLFAAHPEHGYVGRIHYERTPDKIEVHNMTVYPQHQRRGVASQLMAELERRNPDTVIDHGVRTQDGGGWAQSYYGDPGQPSDDLIRGEPTFKAPPTRGGRPVTGAYDPITGENAQTPPDACSFCGNPGPWTDEQDTGRGTRIRCGTCGGTMRLNSDETSSGIQWAPEFPNSPENAASRAGDPRATLTHFEIQSALNAVASAQAGYTIFTAPELAAQVEHQIMATAAAMNGVADEDFVFQMTASWADVQRKAKRIRAEGGVRILAASHVAVVGEVTGDTATYESEIDYVPGSRKVGAWHCGCKWGAYAWGRSPGYRRFEGRQCSHVLALQYEAGSRGMFGAEVAPDREHGQPSWAPVQTEHVRGTDRAPERPLTRRQTPPGNMRRQWDQNSRVRVKGALHDVPASFEWARLLTALGNPPSRVLDVLQSLGVPHTGARAAIDWATKGPASAEISVQGVVHRVFHIGDGQLVTDTGLSFEPRQASLYIASPMHPGFSHYSDNLFRVTDPRDESFARMTDGGFLHPGCEAKHEERYSPHEPNQGISYAELRSKMPHGVTCDECQDHIVEPRPHHESECEYGGHPDEGGDCQEEHTEHDHDWGSHEDLHTQQQEQGDWEHTYHQRKRDEESAGHDIEQMFSGHPGLDMLRSNPTHPTFHSSLHTAKDVEADDDGGQTQPGQDIPGLTTRDQSKRKKDKRHLTHHTNDGRSHAPVWGYGLPWGGQYGWCGQCNGSGCGHCGGTGQVATGNGLPADPSDASSTETPVPNGETVDSGSMVGDDGGGMSATGALTKVAIIWDEIGERHPDVYGDPEVHGEHVRGDGWGIGDAATKLAFDRPGSNHMDGEGEGDEGSWDLHFQHEMVHPRHIDYARSEPGDPRVRHAFDGYQRGHDVPPVVLVHRHGIYQVADGHHRAQAGHRLDAEIPAYVAYSPHEDKPFSDGGRGPFHGAEPHPGRQVRLANYTSNDFGAGQPAPDAPRTPHTPSANPGSTGWGTSSDPGGWVQPIINDSFGRWEAAKSPESEPPTVSGVALKAADTGRVLMIQRSNKDEKDPARGTWEFPGGHHEEGDQTSLHAGIREWEEEVGQPFPEGGHVAHTWRSGPYQGHVVVIPEESSVDFSNGRSKDNPDDPDHDDHEQAAWWEIEHARKNPALRSELKSANPFGAIKKAAEKWTMTDQDGGGYGELPERPRWVKPNGIENCRNCGTPHGDLNPSTGYCPMCDNHANTVGDPQRRNPTGGSTHAWWTHGMDEPMTGQHEEFSLKGWRPEDRSMHTLSTLGNGLVTISENLRGNPVQATYDPSTGYNPDQDLSLIFSGVLNDEPEPALPVAYGGEEDEDSIDGEDDDAAPAEQPQQVEAMPGLDPGRIAPWGYPESAAEHPNPAVATPSGPVGSGDLDPNEPEQDPGALLHTEGMVHMPGVPEDVALAAQFNPALAGFAQTAGFKALMAEGGAADQGPGMAEGGPPNDSDIARAAQALLSKTSMKSFTFAEQQELIGEGGGKARARNFDDLKIAGTHYANISEDDDPINPDAFLLL